MEPEASSNQTGLTTSIAADAPKRERFYIPALDGLRALAVWMIIWHHGLPNYYGGLQPVVPPGVNRLSIHNAFWEPIYIAFWRSGGASVPLFFCLSAFLITRLLQMEKAKKGNVSISNFYIRRMLRVWPLYFLTVAVGIGIVGTIVSVANWGVLPWALIFMANATFVHPSFYEYGIILSPFWTLCVEEQYYLIWPQFHARLNAKVLQNICFGVIGVAILSRLWIAAHHYEWQDAWFNSLPQLDGIAWGVILGLNYDRIPKAWAKWKVYGFGLLCYVFFFFQAWYGPTAGGEAEYSFKSAISYTLVPIVCALIVMVCAAEGNSRRLWFAKEPMVYLGKITFGIYCWHGMVIWAFRFYDRDLLNQDRWLWLFIYYLGAVSMASVTYFIVELPFLSLKERFQSIVAGGLSSKSA